MTKGFSFTEVEIQQIFGHEAAEDEDPKRLREYYFKSKVYEKITAELPLRILVGHKGIGKSALFHIAMQEDKDKDCLPILIRPNDVAGIGAEAVDFLEKIRDWKEGLVSIIAEKIFNSLGLQTNTKLLAMRDSGGKILNFLQKTFRPLLKDTMDLSEAQKTLISNFLNSGKIKVYIDDLDRGWEGRRADISRISALLNALRDLAQDNEGICFRVALRSDVYYLVRTSDESTDKIEGSVIWLTWTNHEILALLVKRIETFFGRSVDEESLLAMWQPYLATHLNPVMEERFEDVGKWQNAPIYRILMSVIRRRPRDLVKLCTLAARHTHDRHGSKIGTVDFKEIFEEYSQGRVQDAINEYKSELPDIERLILSMRPKKINRFTHEGFIYTTDKLIVKLKNIIEQGQFKTPSGAIMTPRQLHGFLYKINFLTARKEPPDGKIQRKYFEENRYLSGQFADFGYAWEVHPAYRWALEPYTTDEIFEQLELSEDDE